MMFALHALASRCRKTARALLPWLAVGVLSACGGGGGSGASIQSGQFLDSAVTGLAYYTQSRSGVTDANGRFFYWPGETVTFRLQGLYIGEAPGAAVLTPSLITPSGKHSDYSLNVLRLLQSLDSNQMPSNGISLGDWQITQNINFNQPTDSFANSQGVIDLINAASAAYNRPVTLVSAGSASDHFGDTLKNLASNSNYSLNLSTRTVSRATMRVNTCPDQESVWSLVFNAQNVSISGDVINVVGGNCVNNPWTATPLPYIDSGTSMKTNAFFVPCGPVCTLAELNQTYTATDDDRRPFSAKVAHMANTREILITKSYTDGQSPSTAYFRLLLSAP